MADVVKEIEITAALSADYQDAFKAASSIAASSARELQGLTKREKDLNALVKLSSDAASASASGRAKDAEKLTAQYDKLAERLGLVDKSAKGVADELARVGARKKDVQALNASASKSAAFGKLARDIQTYTKAAKKTKDPAIIKQLDQMKKKFREMGGAIPSDRKLGFFTNLKASLSQLPGPIGRVAGGFGGLSKAALVVGGFTAVAAAAVGLTKKMWDLGVSTIEAADAIAKTSKQVGISAESYQELAWAVGLGGASEQELASGLQTLNKQMEAATAGNKRAQKAFASLGISMDEVKSMNAEEMFMRISDGLAQVDDVAAKTKTTMELFGGSGAKLAEAIAGGSAELEKMRSEAREAGYVMSADDLKRAEEAADNYSRAQMQITAATRELGVEVMPIINETLTDFVALIRENRDDIKEFTKLLSGGFKVAMRIVTGEIEYLLGLFKIIKGGVEYWEQTLPELGTAISDWAGSACDSIVSFFGEASDSVSSAFSSAQASAGEFFGDVGDGLAAFRDSAAEKIGAVGDAITGIPDTLSQTFGEIKGFLSDWFDSFSSEALAWIQGVMDSISDFVLGKVSWLSDSLKSVPLIGRIFSDDDQIAAAATGGGVTVNITNAVDARGAAPGAGAEIARAVRATDGQTGQSIAAALGSYNDLSYAG